ncbi:MAG: triose-phosphate isomerase [Proteobacteria bacterium]|nr:triose-phosphate isomerase [Pseudomonadota bacterium]MCP4918215.1 triose-phosphate isomerase [Pseudomonadota bacterium]
MARRPFIAGNWKMNKGPNEADELARELKSALAGNTAVDVAVAPPSISIPAVAARLQHTGIQVAAQDLHPQVSGAFTGQISGEMIRQLGVAYALCGHSERRALFGDTDVIVNAKVKAAFRAGLLPVLCVGETLEQRDGGQVEAVIEAQLSGGLEGLEADQVAAVTLAYEPVWAIGTGRTASPAQAQEVHAFIRGWLGRYPDYVARTVRIQYGGSVKPGNAAELLAQPDIDGALVGGAALNAESFAAIVAAATA